MKTGASLKTRQGGAVAVMVGISMVMLIGFLALVIDLGHLYVAKTGLQNAADAAALSGAKELDGTLTGVSNAVGRAQAIAQHNTFFASSGQAPVVLPDSAISFCASPNCASWATVSAAQASPSNMFFIKVDTASVNLTTWFAPIWGILQTSTYGVAVAGRFPPGAIAPLYVPVVRRNSGPNASDNQVSADATYANDPPYCRGVIYDPAAKNPVTGNKLKNNSCPYDAQNCVTDINNITTCVPYRVPDNTGNWGFLKANEVNSTTPKSFPSISGGAGAIVDAPQGVTGGPEFIGSYYVITPTPNNSGGTPWASGTSWTGNFGFMLHSDDVKTLNELAAALCRGGTVTSYSVPGCGEVKTGNVSGPKIGANINTRFDLYDNQTQLPQAACPPDTNIYDPGSTSWTSNGYYADYSAGTLTKIDPTNNPPGKANRRLINVYVADNVWLPGEDLPGGQDTACTPLTLPISKSMLTGGSKDAHLVGCAQFFIWTKAANDGKLYGEFVKKLDPSQCGSSLPSFTEIRLYR